MTVLGHIWAEARGAFFDRDLADQAALDQSAERIVNGGEGNLGKAPFSTGKDLLGGRMVVTFRHNAEYVISLPRVAQSAPLQPLHEAVKILTCRLNERFDGRTIT